MLRLASIERKTETHKGELQRMQMKATEVDTRGRVSAILNWTRERNKAKTYHKYSSSEVDLVCVVACAPAGCARQSN